MALYRFPKVLAEHPKLLDSYHHLAFFSKALLLPLWRLD